MVCDFKLHLVLQYGKYLLQGKTHSSFLPPQILIAASFINLPDGAEILVFVFI